MLILMGQEIESENGLCIDDRSKARLGSVLILMGRGRFDLSKS